MSDLFDSSMTPRKLRQIYSDGFQGAPINMGDHEALFSEGLVKEGDAIAHLVRDNPGNGKRAYLWRSREKYDKGAYGDVAQKTGDCTSFGCRNSRDTTRSVEIHIKGEAEEYYKRGATEPTYGARGHSGQGMSPSLAARFVTQYGWMVRQNYPGCVDLTRYNSSIGSGWGRRGPPTCVKNLCKEHNVGEYLTPRTPDEAMALFQNGYACHSGQNIGFSSTPSKRGIHERKGNWNHDMATVGYDDTKEIWNTRVYMVANSWGNYGSQWKKWRNDSSLQNILGPPITGMIVVDGSVWERYFLGGGSIYFYSDVEGFPSKTLPNYGTSEYL